MEPNVSNGIYFMHEIGVWRFSTWLHNIKALKTIPPLLSIMSMRLATIVKPPSTMKVELTKRQGIMRTWLTDMLATQGIMQRKPAKLTFRNTARGNRNS